MFLTLQKILKRVVLCLSVVLILASSASAKNLWQASEDLDFTYTPKVNFAGEASDGKIWVFSGKGVDKATGYVQVERVDPISGAVLGKVNVYEPGRSDYFGLSNDDAGGVYANGFHISADMKVSPISTAAPTRGLPGGRWLDPNTAGGKALLRGPRAFQKLFLPYTYFDTRYFADPLLGLWLFTEESGRSKLSRFLLDGTTAVVETLAPRGCNGIVKVLDQTRALFGRCLVDLSTGNTIAQLAEGAAFPLPQVVLIRSQIGAGYTVSAYDIHDARLLWQKVMPYFDSAPAVGSRFVAQNFEGTFEVVDAQTGVTAYALPASSYSGPFFGPKYILSIAALGLEVRSAETGQMLNLISASEFRPNADTVSVTSDETGVFSASVFADRDQEFVQVSKHSNQTGALLWRKKLPRSIPIDFGFAVTNSNAYQPLSLTVGENTLVFNWGISGPYRTLTTILALQADTGSLLFRKDGEFVNNLQSFPYGTGNLVIAEATDRGNISARTYVYSVGRVQSVRELLTPSDQLLWANQGYGLEGGDFLDVSNSHIARLREQDGVAIWRVPNPIGQSSLGMISNNKLMLPTSTSWTFPEIPTFFEIDLANGSQTSFTQQFPLGYQTAAWGVGQSIPIDSGRFPDNVEYPLYFYGSENLPPLSLIFDRTASRFVAPPAPSANGISRFPHTYLDRGLVAVNYATDPGDFNKVGGFALLTWRGEILPGAYAAVKWSNITRLDRNVAGNTLIALSHERIHKPNVTIERIFDGQSHSVFVQRRPALLDTPSVSLSLEEIASTVAGPGHHTLLIKNKRGNSAIRGAELLGLIKESFSYTCKAVAGSCSQSSGEGSLALSLDLERNGVATIDLTDFDDRRGNAVVLFAPRDEVEDDISDNVISFGERAIFFDGFEDF